MRHHRGRAARGDVPPSGRSAFASRVREELAAAAGLVEPVGSLAQLRDRIARGGTTTMDEENPPHQCPARYCTTQVDADKLFCPPHYRLLPGVFRAALLRTWDHGRGKGSAQHTAAIRAAIDQVDMRIPDEEEHHHA
jgi:hypothetical protein